MYKELFISIIIIVSILILDFMTQDYTDKSINDTISCLNEIKDQLQGEKTDKEKTLKKIEEIYNKWLDHHNKLAFFIEHNELEKGETSFATAKSFIEIKRYEEAIPEIEKTVYILKHINEKYSVDLKNIF